MYRFKDARGFTHALEDLDALRLAIAEGRVVPATPFCEGDGAWTVARLHPAFGQIAGEGRPAPEQGFRELKGWEIAQTWPARVVLVIVTLIGASAFNTLTGGGKPSQAERAAFHRAMTLLSEGDTAAMAGLEVPPRSKALRPAWATMMGGRDVLLHMAATQRRLGLPDDIPGTWMTNDHVLRPSSHPEIRAFWVDFAAYSQLYVDSVFPLTERAVITYAALAKVDPQEMREHLEALREASETTVQLHRTAFNVALTGRRIHDQLVRFEGHLSIDYKGDIVFPFDGWLEEFNFSVARLESLAARVDSLDRVLADRVRDDLASLAP